MNLFIVFFIPLLASVNCQSKYILGDQGKSCNEACFKLGMNCNPRIETNNSTSLFTQLGINCTNDLSIWFAEDQPSYVSDKSDPNGNYGKCIGYINVPTGTQCSGSFWSVSRICRCDTPSSSSSTFGAGYSNGMITTEEKWIFEQVLASGDVGVLTHFWITYGTSMDNGVIVRYYIDGEKNASIQFTPSLACGVGYYDYHGPWGTKWFGKGANDAGWFNNFRIPFQKSIVVTVQHLFGNFSGFYMIVRGSINVPISVGGITLPRNARMNQFVINSTYQHLEFVPLVNITSGPGVHWMATISAGSDNLNFLEGCFHAYFDGNNEFPGVVLSTGTEDYFDSAWYFNAGQFHLPVSGFTHFSQNNTSVTWSAYRFHDMDPLFFKHGFQLVWRIGDIDDAAGMKCMMLTGSHIAGSPGPTEVIAYAWVYTWEEDVANNSCPNGWLNSKVDSKKCYNLISYNGYGASKNQTWEYANANCQLLGANYGKTGSLVSIDSVFSNAELKEMASCQKAFIGIRKDNSTGQWAWSNGDPSKYRNWATGSGESESYYALMDCSDGTWYGRDGQNNNITSFVDSYICQLVL